MKFDSVGELLGLETEGGSSVAPNIEGISGENCAEAVHSSLQMPLSARRLRLKAASKSFRDAKDFALFGDFVQHFRNETQPLLL